MSIIQEALKKAQAQMKGPALPPEPVRPAPPERARMDVDGAPEIPDRRLKTARQEQALRRHDPVAVAALIVVLVIIAVFAASRIVDMKAADSGAADNAAAVALDRPEQPDQSERPAAAGDFPTIQSMVFQRPVAEPRPPQTEFILNGIMYIDGSPRAIINDSMVGVGDAVSGARVLKIEKRNVVLQHNGAEVILDLK